MRSMLLLRVPDAQVSPPTAQGTLAGCMESYPWILFEIGRWQAQEHHQFACRQLRAKLRKV